MLIIDDLELIVQDRLELVLKTPRSTWRRLADLIGDPEYDADNLSSDAISVAHVLVGHIQRHVFTRARSYPWKLARGDIAANLVTLGALAEPPADMDAGLGTKVYTLIRQGFPLAQLVLALTLLLAIVWGTRAGEQGHGSCAVVHKYHPHLTEFWLCVRSLLHQVRALFQDKPTEPTELRKLRRQLKHLHNCRFVASGRALYLVELKDNLLARLPSRSGIPHSMMTELFRLHGIMYRSLSHTAQASYELLALENASRLRDETAAITHAPQVKCDGLLAEQALRADREGKTNIASHHRLDNDSLEELFTIFLSPQSKRHSLKLLQEHLVPPAGPPLQLRSSFFSSLILASSRPPQPAAWQKRLCYHRFDVRHAAFSRSMDEGAQWWIFVFGMQSPLEPWFLEAVRISEALPSVSSSQQAWHMHSFIIVGTRAVRYDELPLDLSQDGTLVISHVSFQLDGTLASNSSQQELVTWEEDWPLPGRASTAGAPPRPAPLVRLAPSDVPAWALKYLKAAQAMEDAPGEVDEPEDDEPDMGALLHDAWREMDDLHAHAPLPPSDGMEFFIRDRAAALSGSGGSIGAEARKGLARRLSTTYGLQQASSWSTTLYTREFGLACAAEWCRRCQHFFDIWSKDYDFTFEYSHADLESYGASAEWIEVRAVAARSRSEATRVAQIDSILPTQCPLV